MQNFAAEKGGTQRFLREKIKISKNLNKISKFERNEQENAANSDEIYRNSAEKAKNSQLLAEEAASRA